MRATVWSDYLCPWCYLGLDRSDQMRAMGVEITTLPYELHPDYPPDGLAVPVRVYDRVRPHFDEVGMRFVPPTRIPNTHRVLATAECVRRREPDAFPRLERALFEAHFVEGRFLDDPEVLDAVVTEAGADAPAVRVAVDAGELEPALVSAREAAWDADVTGTPAWRFDNGFVLPGAQSRETVARIVGRMLERA